VRYACARSLSPAATAAWHPPGQKDLRGPSSLLADASALTNTCGHIQPVSHICQMMQVRRTVFCTTVSSYIRYGAPHTSVERDCRAHCLLSAPAAAPSIPREALPALVWYACARSLSPVATAAWRPVSHGKPRTVLLATQVGTETPPTRRPGIRLIPLPDPCRPASVYSLFIVYCLVGAVCVGAHHRPSFRCSRSVLARAV
jgi:hypothetical protein